MRNIDITEDLINDLADQYDADDNFEVIPKGSKGRQDTKKLSSKEDRKKAQKEREERRKGKWARLDMFEMMGYC